MEKATLTDGLAKAEKEKTRLQDELKRENGKHQSELKEQKRTQTEDLAKFRVALQERTSERDTLTHRVNQADAKIIIQTAHFEAERKRVRELGDEMTNLKAATKNLESERERSGAEISRLREGEAKLVPFYICCSLSFDEFLEWQMSCVLVACARA